MVDIWRTLPGSKRFLDEVSEALSAGRNVLVYLPKGIPSEIVLRSVCESSTSYCEMEQLYSDDIDPDPIETLFSFFYHGESTERSLDYLIEKVDAIKGKIIYIENIPEGYRAEWHRFFQRYEERIRHTSIVERTLFCVVYQEADPAEHPVKEDVCLALFQWDGILDYIDKLLFASRCAETLDLKGVEKELYVTILAELADFDYGFYLMLSNLDFEELLEPEKLLREFIELRGWNHLQIKNSEKSLLWINGLRQGDRNHLAYEYLVNGKASIDRRLWRAEAKILFTHIEMHRIKMVENLSNTLKALEGIDTKEDIVEIGELYHYVKTHYAFLGNNKQIKELIRLYRNMRNDLAHLRPVKKVDLLSDTFRYADNTLDCFL